MQTVSRSFYLTVCLDVCKNLTQIHFAHAHTHTHTHTHTQTFKEIGYAYKVLSDAEKRQIYDMGGTEALDQQEGMANLNVDHLLLSILMWEAGQKICFLCFLFLVVLELVVLPILAGTSISTHITCTSIPLPRLLLCPGTSLSLHD